MKKFSAFATILIVITGSNSAMQKDLKATTPYYEILAAYNTDAQTLFEEITPAERVFCYYIYRASLPGNRIATDQSHRHAVEITELCEELLLHKDKLALLPDAEKFIDELTTYLVYLWTNHGSYFIKEHQDEKRTPKRLKLSAITPESLVKALKLIGIEDAQERINRLSDTIFNAQHESSMFVPNNIEASGCNIYHPEFTQADYDALPAQEKAYVNAYFDIVDENNQRTPRVRRYAQHDKYGRELHVSAHWLKKAHEHACKHPELFDEHTAQSLDYLIQFLETGDEDLFKAHSKAWTKTKNRIDYNFGFIEVYQDPKAVVGEFQAEVTIKSMNIDTLNEILPAIEKNLPFPDEYKRPNLEDVSALPNASINMHLFGSGGLGPQRVVAAYCLPNYPDIRTECGSKQIIYDGHKDLGKSINKPLYMKLFYLPEQAEWLLAHDPQDQFVKDILRVHVILHETLGHGSGKLGMHTFKEGDTLTILNTTYKVGDTIPVTNENISVFMGEYASSLEELRAEIIALYSSIFMFDELAERGILNDWPNQFDKDTLIEWLIHDMAWTTIRRLQNQPEGTTSISGAHAQANAVITYYLLDHGGLELVEQTIEHDGKEYPIIGMKVTDIQKAKEAIKDLAIQVQAIKSTGDEQGVNKLFATYGTQVRNPKHIKIIKENAQAILGDLKATANIYPNFEPLMDDENNIIDIKLTWPDSIVDQWMGYRYLALSTI